MTVSSGIGSGIKAGGNFYNKHTESGDSGEVDEKTKQRIETTQKVGGGVAKGTSKVLGGVAKGANFVGKKSKEGKPEKVKKMSLPAGSLAIQPPVSSIMAFCS